MYVDSQLLLSDEQAITVDADSESVIDLGVAGRDIGAGEQLYVVVIVDETFAGGTSLVINLETGATTALGTIISATPTILQAALTAGRVPIIIPIPPNIAERYIGLHYDQTGDFTAGKVTAFVAKDVTTFS